MIDCDYANMLSLNHSSLYMDNNIAPASLSDVENAVAKMGYLNVGSKNGPWTIVSTFRLANPRQYAFMNVNPKQNNNLFKAAVMYDEARRSARILFEKPGKGVQIVHHIFDADKADLDYRMDDGSGKLDRILDCIACGIGTEVGNISTIRKIWNIQ